MHTIFLDPNFLKVVFRNGDGALRVFPPLIDVIHEARLNLAVYYLRQGKSIDEI